jgi:hypothetical protein
MSPFPSSLSLLLSFLLYFRRFHAITDYNAADFQSPLLLSIFDIFAAARLPQTLRRHITRFRRRATLSCFFFAAFIAFDAAMMPPLHYRFHGYIPDR